MASRGHHQISLWIRALIATGLYISAVFWMTMALPSMGVKIGPTSDPGDVFGSNFVLIMSTLSLVAAVAVSRRWKASWFLSLALLVLIVIVWSQVPSLISNWDFKGPPHRL